jgi:hypothetical protein
MLHVHLLLDHVVEEDTLHVHVVDFPLFMGCQHHHHSDRFQAHHQSKHLVEVDVSVLDVALLHQSCFVAHNVTRLNALYLIHPFEPNHWVSMGSVASSHVSLSWIAFISSHMVARHASCCSTSLNEVGSLTMVKLSSTPSTQRAGLGAVVSRWSRRCCVGGRAHRHGMCPGPHPQTQGRLLLEPHPLKPMVVQGSKRVRVLPELVLEHEPTRSCTQR